MEYNIGDIFKYIRERDGDTFKIIKKVYEDYDDITYTLQGLRYKQQLTISQSAINTVLRKINI